MNSGPTSQAPSLPAADHRPRATDYAPKPSTFSLQPLDFSLSSAFTLIEFIGVLAIIAILAAMVAPVVVKQVDSAASSSENANVSAMADALRQYVVQSRSIPDDTTWFTAVGSQLGLAPANITNTTPRGYTRAYLMDSGGWLGTASFVSGYWTQSPAGTTTRPSQARLMIVSTMARALPVSSGKPSAADFNTIWNTPQGWMPNTSSFANWNGSSNDLVIVRIILDPLFHHVILNNLSSAQTVSFSINGSTPLTPVGPPIDSYYLDGSVLGLYDTSTPPNLMSQEIIRSDLSRLWNTSGPWVGPAGR